MKKMQLKGSLIFFHKKKKTFSNLLTDSGWCFYLKIPDNFLFITEDSSLASTLSLFSLLSDYSEKHLHVVFICPEYVFDGEVLIPGVLEISVPSNNHHFQVHLDQKW